MNGYDFVRYEYFATNHFLFCQNGPATSVQFADMVPGYGVLPSPKLDESQESYYHLVDPNAYIFGIPSDTKNIEMVDILLDDWAYMSDDVVEAFYEITLKHRRFEAPDDAEMLDIVLSNCRYEIGLVAWLNVNEMLATAMNSLDLPGAYARYGKTIDAKIKALYKDLQNLDS